MSDMPLKKKHICYYNVEWVSCSKGSFYNEMPSIMLYIELLLIISLLSSLQAYTHFQKIIWY